MAFSLRALFLFVFATCVLAESPGNLAELLSPSWEANYSESVEVADFDLNIGASHLSFDGRLHLLPLEIFGDTLYQIYLDGKGKLILPEPAAAERELVSAQLSAPPVELKVKHVFGFFDPLPPELAHLDWERHQAGILTRMGQRRHARCLRHTGDAHPVIEWLTLRSTGQEDFRWLRVDKEDLIVRSASGLRNVQLCSIPARPGSVIQKPLYHILPHEGDLSQDPIWFEWPGHGSRLDLQVEAIGDRLLEWTVTLHMDLEDEHKLLALRLDPTCSLTDLRVVCDGWEIPCTSWRVKDAGLSATDLPLVILHCEETLSGRVTIEACGSSSLQLLMGRGKRLEVLRARCWHLAPVNTWIDSCSVTVTGDEHFSWWTARGRVPTQETEEGLWSGSTEASCLRAPVLHAESQELLQRETQIAIAREPLRNRKAMEEPVRKNTGQWEYNNQSVVTRTRSLVPPNPFERPGQILFHDPNFMNIEDFSTMGDGGDTLASALLGEDQRLAELSYAVSLTSSWLGERNSDCLLVEEHGEASDEEALRSRFYRGYTRAFPVGVRDKHLWSSTPENLLVRLEAVCSIWWRQEVALDPAAPDWFADGLSRATALVLLEHIRGWKAASELRQRAITRMASRLSAFAESNRLLYGNRAEGSWLNPDISDQLAWRFAILLENLRWRLRNSENLDDRVWREYISRIARMHHVGPVTPMLNVSRFSEVSDRLLFDELEDSFSEWFAVELERFHVPEIHLELGSVQENTVLRLAREDASDEEQVYLPVLLQYADGTHSLLILDNVATEQAFVLPKRATAIEAVSYAPGGSVLAAVKDY